MNLRLPSINAPTAEGQLAQIKSYLFSLINELNYVLGSTESVTAADVDNILKSGISDIENRLGGVEARIKQIEAIIQEES